MNYQARRQAKVTAQNRVNAFVNMAAPLLMEAFRPFIGQEILIGKGDAFAVRVRKAIAPLVEKLNAEPDIRWHFDFQRYSVVLKAESLGHGDGLTYYQGQFQYLLDMNGATLKALYDGADRLNQFPTDWTVEKVEAKRKEISELDSKLSRLRGEIENFARFDN